MNAGMRQQALKAIFEGMEADGQWHEVSGPTGYTHLYRATGYRFGGQQVFIVEARSGNGFRPADTIGVVITDEYGASFRPATYKSYLRDFMGVSE